MNGKSPVPRLLDNFSPAAEHRRQMRWQVWVPLIASIIIFLAVAALTIIGAVGGSSQVARWANLSAVWIIAPMLLAGLIFLAIFGAIIYGMTKLLKRVPVWMLQLQMGMYRAADLARRAADSAVQPVMATSGVKASTQAFWRKISGKLTRRSQA